MVQTFAICKHLFSCEMASKKLSLSQGFITDPVNPDVDGLLENIQWLGKVDIDDYGNGLLLYYCLSSENSYII